jgi:membrane-bound lytic murein transglycosylase B
MDRGAEFWLQHADIIGAAARRFGVDAAMIVAIIGVETLYGERMGSYRVLDALTTLAFAYPPRAAFFGSELESLFLLSREEGPGILDASGSYAGAMGAGQFIPSSFRAYAVDGDGDDRRDLWESWADIVASVANYLSEHGWREGDMVAEPATRGAAAGEPSNRLELTDTVGALRAAGYEFAANLSPSTPAAVIALERDDERLEYWVGYHNFFVITRYNRSLKYAMAAFQLSLEIRRLFETMSERAQ